VAASKITPQLLQRGSIRLYSRESICVQRLSRSSDNLEVASVAAEKGLKVLLAGPRRLMR
jgi:hypothetical protein